MSYALALQGETQKQKSNYPLWKRGSRVRNGLCKQSVPALVRSLPSIKSPVMMWKKSRPLMLLQRVISARLPFNLSMATTRFMLGG